VPPILTSPSYRAGQTLLVITYDETQPMPFIVASAYTPAGASTAVALNHYSLLRMTEDLLGLPPLGAAATATDVASAFGLR
jgi:phosphatidylinositol-3-phosphatase